MQKNHVLTALVENKSGVLNRIASLFRRRRFNIESLTVGHSETPGLSRMTIVVDGTTDVEQVIKQMYKIIEVIKIKELDEETAVIRDSALVTFATTDAATALQQEITALGGRTVKQGAGTLTAEFFGTPMAVDHFLNSVRRFAPLQVARSGATAVATDA